MNITITTIDQHTGKHFHFNTECPDNKADMDVAVYKHLSQRADEMGGKNFTAVLVLGNEEAITLSDDDVYEALADYEIACDELMGDPNP